MKVLGVDPSLTATALCTVAGDRGGWHEPRLSVSKTRAAVGSLAKLDRMRAQAAAVDTAAEDADVVVIEALAFGSRGGATRDLAGVWWLILDVLRQHGAMLGVAPPTVLKKWVTGSGNADKFRVGQHIGKRWPDVELGSDDEADALTLASMGLQALAALPWTPTRHQVDQLDRVEWLDPS